MLGKKPERQPSTLPFYVLLGLLLAYFWRRGYRYGSGDHDEMIPVLLGRLHPELFVSDWFVQSQVDGMTIRSWFLYPIEAVSAILPLSAAVTVLYFLAWFGLAWGVFKLADTVLGNQLGALLATFLAMVVALHWTLGGNDIVQQYLVPEMVGWSFAIPAVREVLRDRLVTASLLLGLATWFHPLVGILTALAICVAVALEQFPRALHVRHLLNAAGLGGLYLLFASPALIPLAVQQYSELVAEGPSASEIFYILVQFRLPHHHLFHSFSTPSYLTFGTLLVLGAITTTALKRAGRMRHSGFVFRFTALTGLLCLVAYTGTEVFQVLTIAKMQFFKLTVAVKLFMIIGISGWIVTVLPGNVREFLSRILDLHYSGLVVMIALWGLTLGAVGIEYGRPFRQLQPLSHARSPLGSIEQWVRLNTPQDAVFAVPPSNDTFRSNAHRAIVVNYKAFPFQQDHMVEWFDRLTDIAPLELPERGVGVTADLDQAYHENDHARWAGLASTYGIDYLLVNQEDLRQELEFPLVISEERWALYRLDNRP